jgi:YggT family protein
MSAIAGLLIDLIYLYMIILAVRVLWTWIAQNPYPRNPIYRFCYMLTEPVLAPIRRRIPPVAYMDISPIVVWLAAVFLTAVLHTFET